MPTVKHVLLWDSVIYTLLKFKTPEKFQYSSFLNNSKQKTAFKFFIYQIMPPWGLRWLKLFLNPYADDDFDHIDVKPALF